MPPRPRQHVLGIDDGPLDRSHDPDTVVVGVVMAGPDRIEAVLTTRLPIDAPDVTSRLIQWIRPARVAPALRAVFLDGITVGGLGVVDLPLLSEGLGCGVIATQRRRPRAGRLEGALTAAGLERSIEAAARAGAFHEHEGLCFQCAGIAPDRARLLLEAQQHRAAGPECVRLAHLIASGIATGESHGS